MPCPHNEITIVQRSQRQSAVAAAAYQSGEKLFCEYDQQVKHYPEKRGIVHNEILLPANAPRSYADRNTSTSWRSLPNISRKWSRPFRSAHRWYTAEPLTRPRTICSRLPRMAVNWGWTRGSSTRCCRTNPEQRSISA